MIFDKKTPIYGYIIQKEGEDTVMRLNYEQAPIVPSIEDNPICMAKTMDSLVESRNVTKVVFSQKRDYEYDYNQVLLLLEIAAIYVRIVREKDKYGLKAIELDLPSKLFSNKWYTELQNILFNMLKGDPLGAYVSLQRILRREQIHYQKLVDEKYLPTVENYINMIHSIIELLDKTKLISIAKPFLAGHKIGSRDVYRRFFHPIIKPDFMFTKLMADYPVGGEEIDNYMIGLDTEVTVFRMPDSVQYTYHVMPPEFKLSEEEYEVLDLARNILAEHKPTRSEFTDPQRMREVFINVGRDLISELVEYKSATIDQDKIDELTEILVRYTIGFGLIEVLLQDENVQDISINSPQGRIPIFIVHGKFDDCKTNIIPTQKEAESWASKLRMISGRPLDEANVILDTELELPGASVRVSTITKPLDPSGLAFSFRRHRDRPWTLPLFIKYKMVTPMAAGLLSFLVDGTRAMMVCGTRSSGKSAFLSSLLIEIMRRYRIITVEDSVSGDSKVLLKDGTVKYYCDIETAFESIASRNKIEKRNGREVIRPKKLSVPSISNVGKLSWKKASLIMRHKVTKQIYKVTTRTGRTLKMTGDHSIFCLSDLQGDILQEEKIINLRKGDRIAVPRQLPIPSSKTALFGGYATLKQGNISESQKRKIFVNVDVPELTRCKSQIFLMGQKAGYAKVTMHRWLRTGWVPFIISKDLTLKPSKIKQFKYRGNSTGMPINIRLDADFIAFLGLWLADGCFDQKSVIFSVSSTEERALVKKIAKRFGLQTKKHSDEFSLMINSSSLKYLIGTVLALGGNAYNKRIPAWVMTLPDKLRGAFLKGLFSGDGCVSDKEIIISLASYGLLDDVQTLFLNWGIIFRINKMRKQKSKANDRTRDGRISAQESIKLFKKYVGFLQKAKQSKLSKLSSKVSTHASTDTVKLPAEILKQIGDACPRRIFNKQDYIIRGNGIGIKKLKHIAEHLKKNHPKLSKYIITIADSDILWDEIVSISKIQDKKQYVYDISVPGTENFIANNILAHNTLELPTTSMRKLGFNIQPMKVASSLAKGSSEMTASDGIRSTLRLGDSSLIVGEVRSKEAVALYEAMRVGAAANVVAGTIHADSPFGLFDRVVNDIGIPKTSFKATDIIIIATPIKSADGMHKNRRITQITEVGKMWQEDPMTENGFVDLMKYDAETDGLLPTDALLDGESEVMKLIAANIPDFAGNWDAVWENVELRAKMKEHVVKRATELHDDEMLEAEFVILANDLFHLASEDVKAQTGVLDSEKIFSLWSSWLEREIKKRKLNK